MLSGATDHSLTHSLLYGHLPQLAFKYYNELIKTGSMAPDDIVEIIELVNGTLSNTWATNP